MGEGREEWKEGRVKEGTEWDRMVWREGGRRREWSERRMARREKEEEGVKRMARSEGIGKHQEACTSCHECPNFPGANWHAHTLMWVILLP